MPNPYNQVILFTSLKPSHKKALSIEAIEMGQALTQTTRNCNFNISLLENKGTQKCKHVRYYIFCIRAMSNINIQKDNKNRTLVVVDIPPLI